MRTLITITLTLGVVGVAAAYDLGNQAPVKPVVTYPENIPNPERQGGDTIETASLIPSIPFHDSGTTLGYTDDYDEVCPYSGSTSPDVVYEYDATTTAAVDIDLCGSTYDTKLYVYDQNLNLVACNDDFHVGPPCFVYSSKLENVTFAGDQTYYIVVDGYDNASGTYVVDVSEHVSCIVPCPQFGNPESEPPLVNGYVDSWNGGCDSEGYPFQYLWGGTNHPILCGVSGWYRSDGTDRRDTDWFTLYVGDGGRVGVTADAEYASWIFELNGTCAGGVTVVQSAIAGPCLEATMTIVGAPNAAKWLWIGPTVFTAPSGDYPQSYDYVCWFDGIFWPVATEPTTWSTVKALYE
jgi:hypothetical protein